MIAIMMAFSAWNPALQRRFALLTALACLWIGTVGALAHTDDLVAMRSFAVAGHRSTLSHTSLPGDVSECVACAWESASLSGALLPFRCAVSTVSAVLLPAWKGRLSFYQTILASSRAPPFFQGLFLMAPFFSLLFWCLASVRRSSAASC